MTPNERLTPDSACTCAEGKGCPLHASGMTPEIVSRTVYHPLSKFCTDTAGRSEYFFGLANLYKESIDTLRQQLAAKDSKVQVHIGTSCLTKDLVWCDCGRGLSLSGRWSFCPNCGRPIDQESYQQATEEAKRNGATLYRNMDDDLLLKQLAEQEHDMRQMVEALKNIAGASCFRDIDWAQDIAKTALRLMKKGD